MSKETEQPPAAAPAAAPPPQEVAIAYESQLSPELRADKSIREAIKDSPKLNDLVKAHRDLKGKLSRAIIIPSAEKPDPEEMKAFRDRMGLPETADGYTFDTSAFKGVDGVEEVVKLARTEAAAMSLTKQQAQKFAEVILKLSKAGKDAVENQIKELENTFMPRLTEATKSPEKATAAVNLMKAFLVKHLGSAPLIKKLAQSGIMYDTDFVLKAAAMAEVLGEEPFIEGENSQRPGQRKPVHPEGSQRVYSPQFAEHYGPRKGAQR